MFLGGLWHGASWNFALWGVLHGILLLAERPLRGWLSPESATRWYGPLGAALTFLGFTLCFVPFRTPDMPAAWALTQSLVGADGGASQAVEHAAGAMGVLGVMLVVQWLGRDRKISESFERLHPLLRVALIAGAAASIPWFSTGETRAFIYFQF